MAFAAEDFHDLVRLLVEHPDWRAELRRLVLSEELLTLPDLVRELVEAQRRTEEQVGALVEVQRRAEERLGRVEERVGRVEEGQVRLEAAMAALAEAQQRTDQQLAALTEAQQRTDQQLAALVEVQRRAEERLGWLEDRVGEAIGDLVEIRYREHAPAYFRPLVRRAVALPTHDLETVLEESEDRDLLTEAEVDDVLLADLVIRGRRPADGQDVYVVVEVSRNIHPPDVERAARRAALLSRLRPAIPVVAGRGITADARTAAEQQGVWVILNGHMAAPDT